MSFRTSPISCSVLVILWIPDDSRNEYNDMSLCPGVEDIGLPSLSHVIDGTGTPVLLHVMLTLLPAVPLTGTVMS